jgi:hypothetical protein
MAVCISGIRELATYANFVEKQAAGVKKSLEKMPAVSPGGAAGILGSYRSTELEPFPCGRVSVAFGEQD